MRCWIIVLITSLPAVAWGQVHLPVTADNSIVDNNNEREVNLGGATTIRLKTYQHHLVAKVDTSALAGRKVTKATLRYRRANEVLDHVTVSSIQGDWTEGTSSSYGSQQGSSCFLAAGFSDDPEKIVPWSFPGSRFPDVVYGNGHSIIGTSESPQVGGYYEWTVPPDVVNAIAVGAAFGIAVFESSDRVDRNPTVYSREASGEAPELLVEAAAGDAAPEPVGELEASVEGVDLGQVMLRWSTPPRAFAYDVTVQGGSYTEETPLPRYLIPFAKAAGQPQELLVQDVLEPGVSYTFKVTAIARGGARSEVRTTDISAAAMDIIPFPGISVSEPTQAGSEPSIADLQVFAIPATDKLLPSGDLLEEVPAGYRTQNPVFDGEKISLHGVRNDVLSFQLVLADGGTAVTDIELTATVPSLELLLDRVAFVDSDTGYVAELLRGPATTYATDMDENASAEQHAQAVLVEVRVPRDAAAQTHRGSIEVSTAAGAVSIPLEVNITDVAIPDAPSFHCEMNDYGYPTYLATYLQLQRVARRFRSHVNLVPYSQRGRTRMDMIMSDGNPMNEAEYNNIAPGDTTTDWSDFTKAFGPLFDASLYADLPWPSAAVDGFYLTFHESWPLLSRDYYQDGTRDAYLAFPEIYEQTFRALASDFVALARREGWQKPVFQVYLNNKPLKDDPPFTLVEGSTPWTLDEPVDFWDFRALRYYAELFHAGADDHSQVDIKFRIDVSRYQYHRGQLDGVVDLAVVNRDLYIFRRLVFDLAKRDDIEIWNYGTANPLAHSNLDAVGWILSCYAMGCRGVLPWSTVKYGSEYLQGVTGDDTQQRALFVVVTDGQEPQIVPSLRLVAYREAALTVEYLELLRQRGGYTAGQIERLIKRYLALDAAFTLSAAYAEDAGTISFADLTATQLWQLRMHVLQALAKTESPAGDGGAGDVGPDNDAGASGGDQTRQPSEGCGCHAASAPSNVPLALVILCLFGCWSWRKRR